MDSVDSVGNPQQAQAALDLSSVAEVAGVAESRHDILVFVESPVDRSAPDGSVLRERLAYMLPQIAQNSQNLLAEKSLPQIAQINTDSLGAEELTTD